MQSPSESNQATTGQNFSNSTTPPKFGWFASIAAGGAIVIGASVLLLIIYSLAVGNKETVGLILKHLLAVVGVPASAVSAFIVVVLLRQVQGPIEFEGLGFKFSGASGPVVLWIFCFLSFVGATKICGMRSTNRKDRVSDYSDPRTECQIPN